MEWYISAPGGEPMGPFSTELVIRGIQAGRIPHTVSVRAADSAEWQPLTRVTIFGEAVLGTPPVAPQAPAPTTPVAQQPVGTKGCLVIMAVTVVGLLALGKGLDALTHSEIVTVAQPITATDDAPAPAPPRGETYEQRVMSQWRFYESQAPENT